MCNRRRSRNGQQAPFAFKNENGLYHGRGATDDKGPALSALFGARYAIEQGIPINVRFLWELEEEIGSPHFSAGLKNRTAIPRPDSVVVSDTIWLAKGKPAMPYGLRGLLGARLTLRTGTKDAHSGVTGGAARNPLAELMEVAQACVDAKTGKVKIPGFYQDVVEPTKAEIKSFLASGFQVKNFKQAYGFQTLRTNDPAEIMRRIWASPTFEVHGLTGGYHGPGVKTVVPGHGELKVSMRLVPNQTPEKAFALLKKHVAKLNPNVKVEREGMLHPFKGLFRGALCRSGEAGGEGRVWERTGVHPRRRINRCSGHHAESLEGADPVHGVESARAWLPRAKRILRLGPGLRRNEGVCTLFCGGGEDGEGKEADRLLARGTRTIRMCSFDARNRRRSRDSLE